MNIGPFSLTEPATALTDYLMAVLAVCFTVDLGRRAAQRGTTRWWSLAFAFLGASALAGGTFHGFQESLAPRLAQGLWRAGLAAASLTSFATMRAVAMQWLESRRQAVWPGVAAFKLAASLVAGALHPEFVVVLADFGLTTLFALGAGIAGRARNPRAFRALSAGVALFALGALVQQTGLSPRPAFNHNDLFHVIQILGNACFFLSARLALPGNR